MDDEIMTAVKKHAHKIFIEDCYDPGEYQGFIKGAEYMYELLNSKDNLLNCDEDKHE